jgi:hypothetical protein
MLNFGLCAAGMVRYNHRNKIAYDRIQFHILLVPYRCIDEAMT